MNKSKLNSNEWMKRTLSNIETDPPSFYHTKLLIKENLIEIVKIKNKPGKGRPNNSYVLTEAGRQKLNNI
jgi:DNA-binding PadR family transcriptional regulator